MGYFTRHFLNVWSPTSGWADVLSLYSTDEDEVVAELAKFFESGVNQDGYYWNECFDDAIKWYGHSHDMKALSKRFPTLVFELSGEGEESGDIWKARYVNGEEYVVKTIITYEPWPEDALVSDEIGEEKDE